MTPLQKKGYKTQQSHYRPLFMLPQYRKIIEEALADKVLTKLRVNPRQYGFKRVIYPDLTPIDVNCIIRCGNDRIATLEIIMEDCERELPGQYCNMLRAIITANNGQQKR